MSERDVIAKGAGRGAKAMGAAAAFVLGLSMVGGLASAQAPAAKPAEAPAAAAPAPAAGAAPAAAAPKDQGAWIKLCDKISFAKKDEAAKDAKDAPKDEKEVCLTQSEQINGNTGGIIVSAALRQIEGSDKQHFMIMVPLGMALPAGVRAYIHAQAEWDKLIGQKTIDGAFFKDLKPLELKYVYCFISGCTAEVEATKELVEQLKGSAGLSVFAIGMTGAPYVVPVPLKGFPESFAGKAADAAAYNKAKSELFAQIRQRQQAAYEKYKAEQMKELPPQPGTEGAAPAAPAAKDAKPAEKKK